MSNNIAKALIITISLIILVILYSTYIKNRIWGRSVLKRYPIPYLVGIISIIYSVKMVLIYCINKVVPKDISILTLTLLILTIIVTEVSRYIEYCYTKRLTLTLGTLSNIPEHAKAPHITLITDRNVAVDGVSYPIIYNGKIRIIELPLGYVKNGIHPGYTKVPNYKKIKQYRLQRLMNELYKKELSVNSENTAYAHYEILKLDKRIPIVKLKRLNVKYSWK